MSDNSLIQSVKLYKSVFKKSNIKQGHNYIICKCVVLIKRIEC